MPLSPFIYSLEREKKEAALERVPVQAERLQNAFLCSHVSELHCKAWSNGLASRRKFWTCVQLAFRLATHLRGLAWTLVELKFGRK